MPLQCTVQMNLGFCFPKDPSHHLSTHHRDRLLFLRTAASLSQGQIQEAIFFNALSSASVEDKHLYEELKARDTGVLFGRCKDRPTSVRKLCAETLEEHQDFVAASEKGGLFSGFFNLGKKVLQGGNLDGLAGIVQKFDKAVNEADDYRVRPQSPWMWRYRTVGKMVGGESSGGRLRCLNTSCFTLPGGDEEDVKRVFKATFGIELPEFPKDDGFQNREGLRTLLAVACYFNEDFFLAFNSALPKDLNAYHALKLANALFDSGTLNRRDFRDRAPFYDVRFATKRHQKQLLKVEQKLTAKSKQKQKRGFGQPLRKVPARPAVAPLTRSDVEYDDLFPINWYRKYREMPRDMIPDLENLCGNINRMYTMLVSRHISFTVEDLGLVCPRFVPTLLGETQAAKGEWHPCMAVLGLIPHLDDVEAALNASVSRDIRDLYWRLAGLPEDKKGEWVNLDDITHAREPMLSVAAQAAWGAHSTWAKLKADSKQWRIWRHLKRNAAPGFVADVQALVHGKRLFFKETVTDKQTGLRVGVVRVDPVELTVWDDATNAFFIPPEVEEEEEEDDDTPSVKAEVPQQLSEAEVEEEEAKKAAQQNAAEIAEKARVMAKLAAKIMQFSMHNFPMPKAAAAEAPESPAASTPELKGGEPASSPASQQAEQPFGMDSTAAKQPAELEAAAMAQAAALEATSGTEEELIGVDSTAEEEEAAGISSRDASQQSDASTSTAAGETSERVGETVTLEASTSEAEHGQAGWAQFGVSAPIQEVTWVYRKSDDPSQSSSEESYIAPRLRTADQREWRAAGVIPYTFTEAGELRVLLAYSRRQLHKERNGLTLLGGKRETRRSIPKNLFRDATPEDTALRELSEETAGLLGKALVSKQDFNTAIWFPGGKYVAYLLELDNKFLGIPAAYARRIAIKPPSNDSEPLSLTWTTMKHLRALRSAPRDVGNYFLQHFLTDTGAVDCLQQLETAGRRIKKSPRTQKRRMGLVDGEWDSGRGTAPSGKGRGSKGVPLIRQREGSYSRTKVAKHRRTLAAPTPGPAGWTDLPYNRSDDDDEEGNDDVLLTYDLLKGLKKPPRQQRLTPWRAAPVDSSFGFERYPAHYTSRNRVFLVGNGRLAETVGGSGHRRMHRWDPNPRPKPHVAPSTTVISSFAAASSFLPSAAQPQATPQQATPPRSAPSRVPPATHTAQLATELVASLFPAAVDSFMPELKRLGGNGESKFWQSLCS